jgi:cyanate lyase
LNGGFCPRSSVVSIAIMITGGILGQHKLTKPQAAAAAKLFGLTKSEQALLNEVPMRGLGTAMPPTDPLI